VAALVAWCCWPYWDQAGSRGFDQPREDLPEIAEGVLSPEIAPRPDRDPFRSTAASNAGLAETEIPSPGEPASSAPRAKEPPSREQVAEILSRLSVDATFIHGSRQMALIGGQVYEPGDLLAIPDADQSCFVAQIFPHKVSILHRGDTIQLTYRNPGPKNTPTKPGQTSGQVGHENGQTPVAGSDTP
jgi:hypothetical protein